MIPSLTGYQPLGRSWPTAATTATSAPSTAAANQLVVDLVQVFDGQAARDAAIADGMAPRPGPGTWASMSATRTHGCGPCRWPATCSIDLLPGDCIESRNHQLAKLAADSPGDERLQVHTFYFTLTVAGGAVHHVQEVMAINAC